MTASSDRSSVRFIKKSSFFHLLRSVVLPLIFLGLMSTSAHARVVDELKVKVLPDGYEITLNFLLSIQYRSHTPREPGHEFYAQLSTLNFSTLTADEISLLSGRNTLGWDPDTGIPLQELTFDGSDPERPQLTVLFTEDVELEMNSSSDLKSLIIKVKTKVPPSERVKKKEEVPAEEAKKIEPPGLPQPVIPEDQSLASMMDEARESLTKGDYDRAVQLYTKILLTAEGSVKQQAQEFLGVARERKGQLAQAKAEYDKYLKEFPQGPDSDRVRQRLAGLVTAAAEPQGPLKEVKRIRRAASKWFSQYYGSLSQFYYNDETDLKGGDIQINRNDFTTDLDLNTKWKSSDLDISARLTGGFKNNFIEGTKNEDSLSALSVDMKDKKHGMYGRLGRQSLTTGGVLGRFDGAYLSKQLNPIMKLNGVFGYPVETVRQTDVHADKYFYGFNIDWGTFRKQWDFNTFFINQENHGLTDRRAIGGEVRYFDPKKAFFTLIDYDTLFNALNIFLFNGHWTVAPKSTINLTLDYRKSPLLMTNNAIQGQSVLEISDLFSRFSNAELRQLALDRTTNSKSVTLGLTQDLNKDLQWNTDMTVSAIEGTVFSAGVDGSEATRPDYSCSTQLVASNVIKEDNIVIGGVIYSNTVTSDTYSFTLDDRFPLTQKIRLGPKIRLDYRTARSSDDDRTTIRPVLHLDYNVTRSTRFEIEGGLEWVDDNTAGVNQKSKEYFISAGYRINF